mmetsp:Transcript_5/g.10  ORF Transcript_5/g.10 Transcript_5/m.10 type:complete len:212 (+) Transcript_5:269-904(+)
MVQSSSGTMASMASHTSRTLIMVSRRRWRARSACLPSSASACTAASPSSSMVTPFLSSSALKPAFLAEGITCWFIMSIMHSASISTTPTYAPSCTDCLAAHSSSVKMPFLVKSSTFLGAVMARIASGWVGITNRPFSVASAGHDSAYPLPLNTILRCSLRSPWATAMGDSPVSTFSARLFISSAMMVLSTAFTRDRFWLDPHARNSKRLPP